MKRVYLKLLLILVTFNLYANNFSNWRFKHLTQYDGMTSNSISSIIQDDDGYLWIGTSNGLNRYDGNSFETYKAGEDSTLLKNAQIYSLLAVKPHIWIGSYNSIQRFDTRTLTFKSYETNNDLSIVNDICRGPNDKIWFGSIGSGCLVYDELNDSLLNINFPNTDQVEVNCIKLDQDSTLWIGSMYSGIYYCKKSDVEIVKLEIDNSPLKEKLKIINTIINIDSILYISTYTNGLYSYDLKDKTLRAINAVNSLDPKSYIYKLFSDSSGNIWVAGDNSGIKIFNPKTENIEIIKNSPNNPSSISNNAIRTMFWDRESNLWIGTRTGGIDKSIHFSGKNIQYYNINDHGEFRGSVSEISSLFIRKDQTVWLGSDGQGLYYFSKKDEILKQAQLPDKFKEASFLSIYEDDNSNLYFGTFQYGFHSAKIKFEDSSPVLYNVQKCKYIEADVRKIIPDNTGNLWLGTDGKGLILYNTNRGILKQFRRNYENPNTSILNDYIKEFRIDALQNIWVGQRNGISYINHKTNEIYNINTENQPNLTNIYANAIEFDHNGYIWIATKNGAFKTTLTYIEIDSILNNNETPDLAFDHFNEENGLCNNFVTDLIIDKENNVWLSSENGISSINQNSWEINSYNINDGLGGNIFNIRGIASSSENEIYFSGKHGISVINPKKIKHNTIAPTTKLKNLQILSQKIIPGKIFNNRIVLKNTIDNTSSISILPNEKVFSVEFVSLSFVDPKSNIFRYKLEGFDKDWNYTIADNNWCTYTNLGAGKYTLLVQGSNNDKLWSENPAKLEIEVIPPFYKTYLFIILSSLIIISTVVILLYNREKNHKKTQKKLELTVRERTIDLLTKNEEIVKQNDELEKANQLKDMFFNIIAHDLLNPISSIYQLLDLIHTTHKEMSEKERDNILKNAVKSAFNTLELVQDLLMWSRNQTNAISFVFEKINIHQLTFEVIETLSQQSDFKHIKLINKVNPLSFALVDEPTIKLVIRNLLSNAIKFSNPSSKIIVGSKKTHDASCSFYIQDFGVGIPSDKIERLFQIHSGNSSQGTSGETGTGLGLNLSYEFIIKNNGKIWVESIVGEGSCFYFTLPKAE